MIFAHAPAGWLCADWLRSVWKRRLVFKRGTWWLLVIAAIGGAFPDVDLFYFHLVSAQISHREFITHFPLFYLPLFAVALLTCSWLKKRWWSEVVWCFAIGVYSHLITDSVGGSIQWLWPFSHQAFGLFSIPLIADSFHAARLLFYSFLMEGVWFGVFIAIWGKRFFPRTHRLFWTVLGVGFGILWWAGFIGLFVHSTHIPSTTYYGDADSDGIENMADQDMDGDGLQNADDPDADGDGVENISDVVAAAKKFQGVWGDPTDGGFIQILSHLGLLTNGAVPSRAYAQAGFFWRQAMTDDYAQQPFGYLTPPTSTDFDATSENRRMYFVHQGSLLSGLDLTYQKIQIGDVVFLAHGAPEAVVVSITAEGIQVIRTNGTTTDFEMITPLEFPHTVLAAGRVWV